MITPSFLHFHKNKARACKRLQWRPRSSHQQMQVRSKMTTGFLQNFFKPLNASDQRRLRTGSGSPRAGKVAIIRDMAAVTYVRQVVSHSPCLTCCCSFKAMLYFLYAGEIKFAPFRSYPGLQLPAQERTGDWNAAKHPSPSAKSIYRLADMVTSLAHVWCSVSHQLQYDIPALKQQAKAYIYNNLALCNIVDEIFSTFSFS
jgi:hypothetical protein